MSFDMYQCLENRNSILKLKGAIEDQIQLFQCINRRNLGAKAKKAKVAELLLECLKKKKEWEEQINFCIC